MARRALSPCWALAIALLAVGAPFGAGAAPPQEPIVGRGALRGALAKLLADPALQGARSSLLVRDLRRGQDLFAHEADTPRNPASGAKLLTAAAALELIGPAYTFTTSLRGARPSAGVLPADLYLVGGGDPMLGERDLWALVQALVAEGVREVSGDLVLDASRYDDQVWPPAYDQKSSDAAFQAPVAALALGFSVLTLRVHPGSAVGQPARVSVQPQGAPVTVDNQALTGKGSRARLRASVLQGRRGDVVRVRGRIGLAAKRQLIRRRATRPVLLAGATLRQLLEQSGVRLRGTVRVGAAPADLPMLAEHRSRPLAEIVSAMGKYSNNFIAEMLIKELAVASGERPGTSAAGVAAVATLFEQRDLHRVGLQVTNGSGLYDANRVSAHSLVDLLAAVEADPRLGPDFVAGLAVAGRDGTLRQRFRDRRAHSARQHVRAKSGTLSGVASLSGYAWARDGSPLAFACLLEDVRSLEGARRTLDRIAAALARYQPR